MNTKGVRATRLPVLLVGFRPFYLLAAAFTATAVPAWRFGAALSLPDSGYLTGTAWHAHEMVFGFAAAVLTGFLLTAARTWTGKATPAGASLAALAGLWAAGRVLVLTGPPIPAMVVDSVFLPCIALAVALPVVQARNWRNLVVAGAVVLLGAANLLFHLDQAGLMPPAHPNRGALLALDLLALLVTLIAGRVIPAFTANAIPAARPRRNPWVDLVSFGSLGVLAVAGLGGASSPVNPWLAAVAGAGAVAHGVRLWLWDLATVREPLLWVLPLSYAWLVVALALRALWLAGAGMPPGPWLHALSVGAMGGLMLGMMTRSALGHTGRTLTAGRSETAAFVLVHLAATLRVFGPLIAPEAEALAVDGAALLWSGAFALFFAAYWPVLTRPRVDETPGTNGGP